ncbi:MAG: TauD/TfdA dioxygenase family protein [Alphaproteobacteria bacterium]|jgi:alpha-ketoglutarate-dependent taurine dioxygenase
MTLTVEKLHPLIGAKITGIDFRDPINAATKAELNEAWMENLILVFPNQPLTDEEHVKATHAFGEPEVFHQNIIKSRFVPEIFRVSNVDEDDNLMMPEHPTMQQLGSARKWHTDSSYRPNPAMGSLLHGIEVSRTGGITCFTNMYAVYDALPEALRQKVEGKKARHDFEMLSRIAAARKPTAEERAAMPPVWQPLVRKHPVTGRKSLYISPIYNDGVEGMEDDDAIEFIAELTEFAGQDRFVYKHTWETDDMLLWDNRCTMHVVTPHDQMERRVMHRTTIVGDGPVIAA